MVILGHLVDGYVRDRAAKADLNQLSHAARSIRAAAAAVLQQQQQQQQLQYAGAAWTPGMRQLLMYPCTSLPWKHPWPHAQPLSYMAEQSSSTSGGTPPWWLAEEASPLASPFGTSHPKLPNRQPLWCVPEHW
jgi:hypothetical protein